MFKTRTTACWCLPATLVAALAMGCAAQVGGGVYNDTADPIAVPRPTLEALIRLSHPREHSPYGGVNFTLNDPTDEAHFGVRKISTALGYRWRYPSIAFEWGGEFGVGQPYTETYEGTGAYMGVQGVIAIRLFGQQDAHTGFAPIAMMVDFTITPSIGFWTEPFGGGDSAGDTTGTFGVTVGFRLWTISDLVTVDLTGGGS